MAESKKTKKAIYIGLAVIALIGLSVGGYFMFKPKATATITDPNSLAAVKLRYVENLNKLLKLTTITAAKREAILKEINDLDTQTEEYIRLQDKDLIADLNKK